MTLWRNRPVPGGSGLLILAAAIRPMTFGELAVEAASRTQATGGHHSGNRAGRRMPKGKIVWQFGGGDDPNPLSRRVFGKMQKGRV